MNTDKKAISREIGNRIKSRRIEMDLSQAELANRIGYSGKSMIARIESGDVDLNQSKLIALSNALDVSPTWLLGWDDGDIAPRSYYLSDEVKDMANFLYRNPEYKVLFDASRKVKPEDIEFVKKMIEKMQ